MMFYYHLTTLLLASNISPDDANKTTKQVMDLCPINTYDIAASDFLGIPINEFKILSELFQVMEA